MRRHSFLSAHLPPWRPPPARPQASTAALIALALAALMPSNVMCSSSSRRSMTPQVKAPCAPPPCRARLISLGSPREVVASSGLAAGSLATLASIVSAPCRGTGGFKSRACRPSRMYAAVLAAGNAERVLCGCAPVIALAAAQKSLLPVGDDQLGPDVPDLLEQLSAMPGRVI